MDVSGCVVGVVRLCGDVSRCVVGVERLDGDVSRYVGRSKE